MREREISLRDHSEGLNVTRSSNPRFVKHRNALQNAFPPNLLRNTWTLPKYRPLSMSRGTK